MYKLNICLIRSTNGIMNTIQSLISAQLRILENEPEFIFC